MVLTDTTPLPPLRYDLDGLEVIPGIVMLYDDLGYSETRVQLPVDVIDHLLSMDGRKTVLELAEHAAGAGRPFDVERFLEVVRILEEECLLDNVRFHRRREEVHNLYNSLSVRPPAHAGQSYPDDPDELRTVLDDYLSEGPHDPGLPAPVALFAPHIDPRVGGRTYGPAYNALRNSPADTFVILGVPHRMCYDRFMLSRMDFDTPLGVLPTDRQFVDRFREKLSFALTEDEIAHKAEHSIEFQAVFLRHIFPDRDIRIVPVLAGSLYEYVEAGKGNVRDDRRLNEVYEMLGATADELGRNVCWIAGVDFCHVGRKFGDPFPARQVLDDVREHDMDLIGEAVKSDPDAFLRRLANVKNGFKVCGVSPMYALLRIVQPSVGRLLAYDQWDEEERESAVSFASVAFYR